jgi:hypothetical protein
MIDDQNDKVSNGDQSNNAGIFQGIEPAKEGKRDNEKPVQYKLARCHDFQTPEHDMSILT